MIKTSSETVAIARGPIGIAQRKATIRKAVAVDENTRDARDLGATSFGEEVVSVFSTSVAEREDPEARRVGANLE